MSNHKVYKGLRSLTDFTSLIIIEDFDVFPNDILGIPVSHVLITKLLIGQPRVLRIAADINPKKFVSQTHFTSIASTGPRAS